MINQIWYKKNYFYILLIPFSYLYLFFFSVHKLLYRLGIKKVYRSPVPVICVGNLTVGGTGKTPFTIALANRLRQEGYRPGIVSRGYKGQAIKFGQQVVLSSHPAMVGDEPTLIRAKTYCPIVVAPKRARAIRLILENNDCNVIIADDGLQHHGMHKDLEILLVDEQRKFGNGYCLPAGPLREPSKRISQVDFVLVTTFTPSHLLRTLTFSPLPQAGEEKKDLGIFGLGEGKKEKVILSTTYSIQLTVEPLYNLCDKSIIWCPELIKRKIYAIAGIGHPERFFTSLQSLGFSFTEKIFPNHHAFKKEDFAFCREEDLLIMTEKDAVKCVDFARPNFWVLPVVCHINPPFLEDLLKQLKKLCYP